MPIPIPNLSDVKIGAVGVCWGFNPLAKTPDGKFVYVEGLRRLKLLSGVNLDLCQIPLFPEHVSEQLKGEVNALYQALREEVSEVLAILMFKENPLDPANEAAATNAILSGLMCASGLGVSVCSATSLEAWMDGTLKGLPPLRGEELEQAIDRLIRIHVNAITRAKAAGCNVQFLDIEYLRTIEFMTFTDMEMAYRVISGINKRLGYVSVRLLDDTAHAKDSGYPIALQHGIRKQAAADGAYGTFHWSEPTTRGLVRYKGTTSVDEGLASAVQYGKLSYALAEGFDCEGSETQLMRDKISGYGVKTYRSIDEMMAINLRELQLAINTHVREGRLAAKTV